MMPPAISSHRPQLALAAGGTGGHMIPAAALAQEMEARGWAVALFTDVRGLRFANQFPESVKRIRLPVDSVFRGSWLRRLWQPGAMLFASARLVLYFFRNRTTCVAAFGGYATLPVLVGSVVARVPYILHEQNAVPGRVNRLFARWAKYIACGVTPNDGRMLRAEVTGTPVRPEVRNCAAIPYQPPTAAEPIRVVVAGGSQGSYRIATWASRSLAAVSEELRCRLIVSCQARAENIAEVMQNFDEGAVRAEVSEFFADLPERLGTCHLVIARAGASSLAEIAAIGRPAVLIPLPTAANDHQLANARSMAVAGGAELFEERGGSPEQLAALLERLLTDGTRLAAMAKAMRELGRADAAQALGDIVARCAHPESEADG